MSGVQPKVSEWAVAALGGFLACILLSGCQALADMRARQEAQRRASEDSLRERLAALTSDQKDAVRKCSSIAVGRFAALRKAGQGAGTYGMNDSTITDACLENQYYYQMIPAPTAVASPPPPQLCLAAQAPGVGVCR
jgi:hypothetical protein